ncbi:MAG: LacI family transcriptional regulator, partial [Oscillospiraceae bacterium]|nr:LacI family transcriptional regulator [Oscillospiraceae bacterium]
MANIKDVAKLAGVSASTVSRTLSGKVFVDAATKKKVLEAVNALGYSPNYLAQSLKGGKTHLLAVILPDIAGAYYPAAVKAIEKYAAQNGYSLMLFSTDGDIQKEIKILTTLKHGYADGIIILPCGDEAGHIPAHKDGKAPVVVLNRAPDGDINCASTDNIGGAYDVMCYLIEKGHRKISAVLRGFEDSAYRMRCDGAMEALRQNNLEHSERYFVFDADAQTAGRKIRNLLTGSDRPTAFFLSEDAFAPAVYSAAAQLGIRIPQDISVAGYGDTPAGKYMLPELTTYDLHTDEICEAAVKNLMRRISRRQKNHEKQFFRGEVIERGSVAEAN